MGIFRYLKNTRGTTAMLFAIGALPLMAAIGCGIDYGSVVYARASADAAADAAVLFAIRTAEVTFAIDKSAWKSESEEVGRKTFIQNLSAANLVTSETPVVNVKRQNGRFEAEITYKITYPTAIMHLFSRDAVKIRNTAIAESGSTSFVSVHVVIDNSASMGIGASVAEQTKMIAPSAGMGGCAFACHMPFADTVLQARAIGAKLRIDIAKEGARDFLENIKELYGTDRQVEVTLHTFANDLKTLQSATTDIDEAIAATSGIELTKTFRQGGTLIENSLKQLSATLGTSGDGSTQSKRQSFVVVLTDGIENSLVVSENPKWPGVPEWNMYESPPRFINWETPEFHHGTSLQGLNPESCEAVKSKGHTLMIANVKYVRPIRERPTIDTAKLNYIEASTERRKEDMKKCASRPEYAYFAADSSDIKPAFDNILKAISSAKPIRLTH
jgi:Flp pilus assembly protein TadG